LTPHGRASITSAFPRRVRRGEGRGRGRKKKKGEKKREREKKKEERNVTSYLGITFFQVRRDEVNEHGRSDGEEKKEKGGKEKEGREGERR